MKTSENTILITGAASGIGLEIAKLFSQNDNVVIMVDKTRETLDAEVAKLPNAIGITADLTKESDINRLIQAVKLDHSAINVVILNAAVANNYLLYSDEFDLEYAASEINTNYLANVRLTHALEQFLNDKKEAAFVLTTSGLAFVPNLSFPTYSVTKAALHSFAVASRLALKRKGSNIKFFDLMPPITETPLAKGLDAPKISAAEVAALFLDSFKNDELEIHIGDTEKIYQLFLKSPQEALLAVNPEI